MMVTVWAPEGTTVNLRKKPSRSAALVERIPVGSEAELLDRTDGWCRIRYGGWTGWMMSEYLKPAGDTESAGSDTAEGDHAYSVVISGLDLTQARALVNNYPGNSEILEERIVG